MSNDRLLLCITRVLIFMPWLDYMIKIMLGSIPHQKLSFLIIYLLEDEQELSLGMLIRLQRIYKFLMFHVVIIILGCFTVILYHFLVLTYWHSAKCQLLFSACFLHRRKLISNGVQTPRNFLEIFYGPEDTHWARAAPGGASRGAQPTRAR